MPLYDYSDGKHVTESRQGVDVESIPCPRCGTTATRVAVYHNQYMQAETGPKGGTRSPVPVSERRIGQDTSEYTEALGEVTHAYEKEGKESPNLVERAKKRARALGAPIA